MVLHGITPEEDSITNGRLMVNGSLLNFIGNRHDPYSDVGIVSAQGGGNY